MEKNNFSHGQDIPLGLSMAMAQNPNAIHYFGQLSEQQKQTVLNCAYQANSKREMKQIVETLSHEEMPYGFKSF